MDESHLCRKGNQKAFCRGSGAPSYAAIPFVVAKKIPFDEEMYDTLPEGPKMKIYLSAVEAANTELTLAEAQQELARLAPKIEIIPEPKGESEGEFDNIRILSNKGAQSDVFKADWRGKTVVIKVYKEIFDEEEIKNEVSNLKVVNTPEATNVIKILDITTIQSRIGIVMEFFPDGTLEDALRNRNEPLKHFQKSFIAVGLLKGLHHIHELGLIHRDLKPPNVLLKKDGTLWVPVITDFGVSRLVRLRALRTISGTLDHMAPEVLQRLVYTKKADVYSLGILLWEMWSGEVPWAGLTVGEIERLVIDGHRPDIELITPPRGGDQAPIARPVWLLDPPTNQTSRAPAPATIRDIIPRMWHQVPKQRPTPLQLLQSIQNSDRSRNIIFFGETGVGKSSIIKMLTGYTGTRAPEIKDSALGCTFAHQKYPLILHNGEMFNLFDTSGFNEADFGTVPAYKCIQDLFSLLNGLKQGVSLLVFVMKKGRSHASAHQIFKIFHTIMCRGKVPCVMVVTGCEDRKPMQAWWEENQETLKTSFKNTIDAGECITTIQQKYPLEFWESKERVFNMIYNLSLIHI
eukprot:TRINITY_DN3490_c0_g1_i2.p1 TRINITY_DN3490_c0_g1~~TRINITY_DN3490_c0_g1_i2.p1  ORF type:complete len:589 (+),score=110.20 TRINITY_DN3490_c0_g1_i2:47-1768(+)